ncbi:MAG: type II toxin-antitoxin system RelE/ParE family toxin [Candidatus Yanofskybacteria bacterium]|nr:type II toxin-antitoxin system RelE/ParE family toxin [Candidatus Yanofskybacteria bacterium]
MAFEWKTIYTKQALNDLQRFSSVIQRRIAGKVRFFTLNNPLKFAKKLVNNELGSFRFRIGEYRVIFDIIKNRKEISILKIAKRDEIYK